MMVARRIARNFPGACRGADVAMVSDLPPSAGLSSSAALTTGIFLALSETNQLPARDEYWHNIGNKVDLAGYLGALQTGQSFGTFEGDPGTSLFGGGEDHTAILCSESNHISQYAYCPVGFERMVRVPPGHVFAIGASGVVAEATVAAQQQRSAPRRLADALAELWRRETGRDDPHLADALCSTPDAGEQLTRLVETADVAASDRVAMVARLEHFMIESGEIIPEAGDALSGGDLRAFGRLVDRSQHLTERLLGDQTPETLSLVASARRLGAVAASTFGAGFGGSVWALLETSHAEDILTAWADGYRAEFAQRSQLSKFFLTGAGPAAFRVC
jgi:galactokinase